MTKEEIIKMLRASCDKDRVDPEQNGFWVIVTEELEAFAKLVAEKAIEEALAQPEQEPVAWMFQHDETGRMNYVSNDGIHNPTTFVEMNPRYALVCPLYTTPPQRTWVRLTHEEADKLWGSMYADWELIRLTESKLKDKNTRGKE